MRERFLMVEKFKEAEKIVDVTEAFLSFNHLAYKRKLI